MYRGIGLTINGATAPEKVLFSGIKPTVMIFIVPCVNTRFNQTHANSVRIQENIMFEEKNSSYDSTRDSFKS